MDTIWLRKSLDKQDRVNGAIVQLWIDMYVKGAQKMERTIMMTPDIGKYMK